jgi:hypothetical protein
VGLAVADAEAVALGELLEGGEVVDVRLGT